MTLQPSQPSSQIADKGKLLIIDDDEILATRLGRAMEKRGFTVALAHSVQEGLSAITAEKADYALIDLQLGDGSGLNLVEDIREHAPDCRIVMLTAFGNIATAVAAVKAGAIDYLAKPADADAVENALLQPEGASLPPPPEDPMPADRVRWEHIQRIYEQCGRNISETARRLKMHRRTLQRILAKHAPQEHPCLPASADDDTEG